MKEKITSFIDGLLIYDYILFGSVFFLFLLFVIIGIIVRKKLVVSILLVLLAFAILLLGPTLGYIVMHKMLFANSVTLTMQKKLEYTQAVVVKGSLINESRFNFTECKITASAYKLSSNPLKKILFPFKPFQKSSHIEYNIEQNTTREFKMFVEPFTYAGDYNISLGANCK
jgi:hypothetical protein